MGEIAIRQRHLPLAVVRDRTADAPAKEDNYALEPPKGYMVCGCWELKWKFPIKLPSTRE